MPLDDVQGTPTTTADVANAANRNLSLSTIATALSDNTSSILTALASIASAVTASIIGGTTGGTANRILVAKGTTGRALQATVATVDPATGDINTNGGDLTVDDITADDISAQDGAFSATLTKAGTSVAIVTQTVGASFTFKFPEDETVILILNAAFAWTITQTNAITEVGTSSVTTKIGTTALGGGANSASTVINTVNHSTNNAVAVTNSIAVTFASTSSDCENLCLTIWGTRTLA